MANYPLNVLLGPSEELVLIDGEIVAGLTEFELHTRNLTIETRYVCVNCFPRPSGHRVPELGKYPLRIYAGDTTNDFLVTHGGRPLGALRAVHIKLSTTKKRIVQFTLGTPLPKELDTALLDLGVELIVTSADALATGVEDANL
jgi:hypothetical protein